jgi:phosphatidate cytidylyltransferase
MTIHDKVKVGLILGIITCVSIILNKLDVLILITLILGLYELIKNTITIKKNNIAILIGIIIIIANFEMISQKVINISDIINILVIIIISDCFQEFTGKFCGRNKIGWISPKKTFEGYIGGYIGILCYYFIWSKSDFLFINAIYLLGVVGDLFFSYIKRKLSIKDYSNLLLSHGGFLDRGDAFIFALFGYGLYKQCYKIENS